MGQDLAQPSPAPDMPRRLRLHRFQIIGIPIVFLLPVGLALAGVFGEAWHTVSTDSADLAATISYPTRYRYKELNTMEVWIENATALPMDTVTIALDSAYANRFSTVRAIPSFDEPYSLSLVDVAPGERRLAIIELQAERYGIHEGEVRIVAGDTARVPIRTIIFP